METRISGGSMVPLQRLEIRPNEISAEKRACFLAELAESCNVQRSARAAGISKHAFYALRKRDAVFAQDWAEALAEGYLRLEEALLAHAIAGLAPHGADEDGATHAAATGRDFAPGERPAGSSPGAVADKAPFTDARLALALLARRDAPVARGRRGQVRIPTPQELDARLGAVLDSIERRMKLGQ